MASAIDDKVNSTPIKIVGASNTTQEETNIAKVSPNQDLGTSDILDNGGADTVLNLTTTPIQGIVSGGARANRKYFIMEALTTNVKWGFTNSTQSFDLFKSQLIMVPVGPNTQIWFRVTTGTGQVAIGEVS
jgi:hypothetical protein